jgi:hypothetical protein
MNLVFLYINMSLATKYVMVIPKPIVKSIIINCVSIHVVWKYIDD